MASGSGKQPGGFSHGDDPNALMADHIEQVAVAGHDNVCLRGDGGRDDVIIVRVGGHRAWYGGRRHVDCQRALQC